MENVISFTPAELVAFITAIGGAIVTIGAVITLIAKIINKMKAPEFAQNERLDAIEDKLKSHEEKIKLFEGYFDNDDKRFKTIENANRITLETLLALLKHAIDGNEVDALKKSAEKLNAFLIEK